MRVVGGRPLSPPSSVPTRPGVPDPPPRGPKAARARHAGLVARAPSSEDSEGEGEEKRIRVIVRKRPTSRSESAAAERGEETDVVHDCRRLPLRDRDLQGRGVDSRREGRSAVVKRQRRQPPLACPVQIALRLARRLPWRGAVAGEDSLDPDRRFYVQEPGPETRRRTLQVSPAKRNAVRVVGGRPRSPKRRPHSPQRAGPPRNPRRLELAPKVPRRESPPGGAGRPEPRRPPPASCTTVPVVEPDRRPPSPARRQARRARRASSPARGPRRRRRGDAHPRHRPEAPHEPVRGARGGGREQTDLTLERTAGSLSTRQGRLDHCRLQMGVAR